MMRPLQGGKMRPLRRLIEWRVAAGGPDFEARRRRAGVEDSAPPFRADSEPVRASIPAVQNVLWCRRQPSARAATAPRYWRSGWAGLGSWEQTDGTPRLGTRPQATLKGWGLSGFCLPRPPAGGPWTHQEFSAIPVGTKGAPVRPSDQRRSSLTARRHQACQTGFGSGQGGNHVAAPAEAPQGWPQPAAAHK